MATPVIMPRQGQSVESCILTEWKVAPGDQVAEGDALAVIETDKASFDLESPVSGLVLELFWEADDDVAVLENVAVIGEEGEDVSEFRPKKDQAAPPASASAQPVAEAAAVELAPEVDPVSTEAVAIPAASGPSGGGTAGVSPRARRLAESVGIDPESLVGTGPEGRVIERDVQAVMEGRPRLTGAAVEAARLGLEPPARGKGLAGMALAGDMLEPGAVEGAEVIPVKGIRKVVADRMMASLRGTAQLTLNSSFDASAAQAFRKAKKAAGEKVSLNDVLAHALVTTILRHPDVNAHFLGDRVARFEEVHLGVAVDSPRGLMVPVVRSACCKSLSGLSMSIRSLAEACRDGEIEPDQLTGGTFTLTNLGMLGVEHFTPVLNAPEVCILGVGGISLKPVRGEEGEVKFVESIALSLTIDHQALDGAPAARFLKDLVEALETYPGGDADNEEGDSKQ